MHKCPKCGTEFEGNFCPECGAKWEEEKKCPKCGKTLAGGVKFCPGCGYSFVSAPAAAPRPAPAARPVTAGTKKLYAFVSVFPAVLFSLLSVVFMLLFLAPVAVMPGGELLGQTIPSESYGNVYEISNFEGSSLTGSLTMLIVFAACALFLTAAIIFTALFIKARYHRVTVLGKQVYFRNFLTGLGYVLFFLLFLISCILLGQISSEDGGFGIFTAGAAPILTLVFSLIGCLIALVCALAGAYLRKSYPVLVAAEKKKIADAKPTGFETWLKYHKKAAVALSILLIAAVVIGVSVPVAIANRHNGIYYVYNGETEEYNMERYYKLSGSTWQDEEGNKGEIVFDGENVTLTYDASGGMDKTGMSKIEMEGTIQKDVLKIGGTVYAKEGHMHAFGEWETADAGTCIQRATETHDCICGRHETRETDKLGDHVYVNGKEATCAEYGIEGEYCSLCGKLSSSAKYIPALHVKYYYWAGSFSVTDLSEECNHQNITIPKYYPHDNRLIPVKEIYPYVFQDCSELTSIDIPDSVTSIGSGAFLGCSSLTSITIPDSVTSIGENAFSGCTSLASVTIGSGVTTIGSNAFSGTAYYDDERNWDGGNVFYMGNILLEAKTTISGEYSIREGTKKIASYAFAGEYTNDRYSGCPNLTSIIIPDSVTSIGEYGFRNCSGLEKVIISDLSAWCKIDFEDYAANPLNYAQHLYLDNVEVKELTVPNEITEIKPSAFEGCSGLTSITIPDSVTMIGDDAFYGCSGLTSITIPDSVTSIGDSAFRDCSGLTSITIPNGVTSIGDSAFRDCSGLTSIEIPDSVTSIGDSAFRDCSGLTSVTIGSGVTSIGYEAFRDCSGLTSIEIPDSVTSIGQYAFYGCSSLESIIIPDGVTSIGYNAFQYCSGLTSITIPEGVTSIGSYAFCGCSGLTSVTIGSGVTSIGSSAFYGCSGLTSVTIGSGVTSIGYGAFSHCSGLTAVHIESLEAWCKIYFVYSYSYGYSSNPLSYAHHLYLNNVEVKELTIPSEITEIKDGAFEGCSGLTSITIPDSVTEIGSSAFSNCSGMTSITIPNSVTSIRGGAFNGCSGLTGVYITDLSAWCKIDFEYWSSNPLSYAHHLYLNNVEVKELTIPNGITEIKPYTFYGCSGLTSITIPDSVTSIGSAAFEDCSSLESITIPDSVTSIGDSAFRDCSGLTGVTIPDGVTSIGEYAFYLCSELTSIIIPESVTSIGNGAFGWCSSLTEIQFKGTVKEWNSIQKGDDWDYITGDYTITCTDGTIDKKGKVTYFEQ